MQDYGVMTSGRRNVIEISNFILVKIFVLVQTIIPPNFVAISQILRELCVLQDYDVMTSRRRYVIKIGQYFYFSPCALFQSLIPLNLVWIS